MAKKTETWSPADERRALKQFLTRYYKAKKQQAILQARLAQLRNDLFLDDERGIDEIEAMIKKQVERERDIVLEIIGLLDLLPPDSVERTILELRHIDCKDWIDIQQVVHLSKTPCYDYYNRGLDLLMEDAEVHSLLKKHRAKSGAQGRRKRTT